MVYDGRTLWCMMAGPGHCGVWWEDTMVYGGRTLWCMKEGRKCFI